MALYLGSSKIGGVAVKGGVATSNEDLSTELQAQNELISTLEETVANKAAGGSGIDTCTLTVNVTDNGMSAINKLVLNKVVDGKIILSEGEHPGMGESKTFTVPCNSLVFMYGTGGGNPNPTHSSNITLINNMYVDTHIYLYKMPDVPGSTATITHFCG
jgi:archaellum component FlaF (FlaF/FlaG flagellin family)